MYFVHIIGIIEWYKLWSIWWCLYIIFIALWNPLYIHLCWFNQCEIGMLASLHAWPGMELSYVHNQGCLLFTKWELKCPKVKRTECYLFLLGVYPVYPSLLPSFPLSFLPMSLPPSLSLCSFLYPACTPLAHIYKHVLTRQKQGLISRQWVGVELDTGYKLHECAPLDRTSSSASFKITLQTRSLWPEYHPSELTLGTRWISEIRLD